MSRVYTPITDEMADYIRSVSLREPEPSAGEQVSDRCPDENPEQQSDQQQDCTHMQR